jgi:hypothetical protein
MIYLDMFFLFLGRDKGKVGEPNSESFYLTKNLQIKSEFKIHNETFYVDKFINYQKGMKLLVSMGRDLLINDAGAKVDEAYIIKLWDF